MKAEGPLELEVNVHIILRRTKAAILLGSTGGRAFNLSKKLFIAGLSFDRSTEGWNGLAILKLMRRIGIQGAVHEASSKAVGRVAARPISVAPVRALFRNIDESTTDEDPDRRREEVITPPFLASSCNFHTALDNWICYSSWYRPERPSET
jgi:hypothetical protein